MKKLTISELGKAQIYLASSIFSFAVAVFICFYLAFRYNDLKTKQKETLNKIREIDKRIEKLKEQ